MTSHRSDDVGGTVNSLFAQSARRYPQRPALVAKVDKAWRPLSYAEVETRQRAFSSGLRALGLGPGDRIALLSENRPDWAVADLSILAMGAVTVPIYPTLPPQQVAHILADSGARAIIASDPKQIRKALDSRDRAPGLEFFITMEDSSAKGDIVSFESVLRQGEAAAPTLDPPFEMLRDAVQPDDLASLVYTSGTTGEPKGAMLTHANFVAAAVGAEAALPFDPPNDIFLSFLPLSHVFERVTYYLALKLGAQTSYAESLFKVQENMQEVQPTVMQSVPRLFEAIYDRTMDTVAKAPAKRQATAHWALAVGVTAARRRNSGCFLGPVLALQHLIADKLVLSKIRARLGTRWRFFVSGGAALPAATAEFFQGIGIPIVEGYGLTETTAAACVNPRGRAKVGSVGKPIKDVKVEIAADGEILISGPTIMKGYWNQPQATADVIDDSGRLHTGDIGEIDRDGYLRITDRKKDIIVLANGKNVAPQPIEAMLKRSPLISEAILLGDSGGTITALIVPDFDHLGKWAKEHGVAVADHAALAASPEARKAVKQSVDELSTGLADFEKIRRIALLDHPLSIEAGELTPTHKVKRRVVQERYGHLLA